jgi:hypothetical protein
LLTLPTIWQDFTASFYCGDGRTAGTITADEVRQTQNFAV